MEPTMWSPQEFMRTNLSLKKQTNNFASHYIKVICQIHPKKGLWLNFYSNVMETPWKKMFFFTLHNEEFKRETFIYMKTEDRGRFSHAFPSPWLCYSVTESVAGQPSTIITFKCLTEFLENTDNKELYEEKTERRHFQKPAAKGER